MIDAKQFVLSRHYFKPGDTLTQLLPNQATTPPPLPFPLPTLPLPHPSLSPSPLLPQLNVIDTKECVPSFGAPGDGVDNDCDLNVDEELYNSIDDDQDGVVDEVKPVWC